MRYLTLLILSLNFIFNSQAQSLDLDFGDSGILLLDKYDNPGYELNPVLDASGQLILAGLPNPSFMNSKVFITKLNKDGSLDTNFGVDGYSEYDLGEGFVSISDFIQLDNGNLVISGTSFQNGWLIMFDPQGNVVTNFGDNGFFNTQISADVNRVLITQVDNRIFALHKGSIGGSAYLATSYYNMDGTYDTSYGNNGTIVYQEFQFNSLNHVSWNYSNSGEFNGAYFSGGNPNGENISFIAYVSSDGILNNDFGDAGLYRLVGADFIHDMALDFNGDLLISARNAGNYVIQKLNNAGEFVADFASGGVFTANWSLPLRNVERIIPTADGGFLHSGSMDDFSVLKSVFQKHNPDGTVNAEIGEIVYDTQPVSPNEMLHADNGDIYIFGFTIDTDNSPDQLFVIKYQSDITKVENIVIQSINVSPNPSSDTSWTISDGAIGINKVQLLDVYGNYILDLEVYQNQIFTDAEIAPGVYILSVITNKYELLNAKVILLN